MQLSDFFNYRNTCPICKLTLTKDAQISVLVDDLTSSSFMLAEVIDYTFKNNRFHKKSKNIFQDQQENSIAEVMKPIYEGFPKTFSLKKKFHSNINKNIISDKIEPWFVSFYDVSVSRECIGEDHLYCYVSDCMFEEERIDCLKLNQELIDINGYRIYNRFVDNVPDHTVITIKDNEINSLPYIPIEKWKAKSKDDMKELIDKYLVLK